jgi:hypothetical protein
MTNKEKQLIHILAQISRRNILSSTTDILQSEIHQLLIKEIDPEYKNFSTKELEDVINYL